MRDNILIQEIMWRVRFIYGVKSLPRVLMPKVALLAVLFALMSVFVSMPHVIANMPSFFDVEQFFRFVTAAFVNTKLVIQGALLAGIILFGVMLRDITRVFGAGTLRPAFSNS